MKKWISGAVILVVIILLGGWLYVDHANKQTTYQTNLDNGNTALEEEDYAQAKKYFQKSLAAKPDSKEANGLVSQVEKFMDGEDELKSNDFTTAKASFNMAANGGNGSTILTNRAKQKVNFVESVMDNIKHFNEIYKMAVEQHNAKNYVLSNETLNQILVDDKINQDYYVDILAKSKDLKKSNDKSINRQNKKTNDADSKTKDTDANRQAELDGSKVDGADVDGLDIYTDPQAYANRFASDVPSDTSDNSVSSDS